MIKSFNGNLVPYYIVMLKHAGYIEVDSFELSRGEFYCPIDYTLVVSERNENDTPALFSDLKLMNVNFIGSGTSCSANYLDIMLQRINEPVTAGNLKHFVNTYGRN